MAGHGRGRPGARGDCVVPLEPGGFLVARRLPAWWSVAIVIGLELIPLIVIRDNLTLNVWMLLAPNDSIRAWQAS